MLDAGVYLPPSAFESWFVSAAHDEEALSRIAEALPKAAAAAAAASHPEPRSTRLPMTTRTIVHLMRHGEVHNPLGVLYGRIAGYHLSDLGHEMAAKVADSLKDHPITHLVASPLERAQETADAAVADPVAAHHERRAGHRGRQQVRGQDRRGRPQGVPAARPLVAAAQSHAPLVG